LNDDIEIGKGFSFREDALPGMKFLFNSQLSELV